MKTIELSAALRTTTGKKAAKMDRKSELVPGIVYGGGENTMISLSERELKKVIYTPDVYLIKLSVDGKNMDVILKEVQFHPVTDKILHVDFLKVDDKKPVTVALPIVITGQAEGVKQGGKLLQVVRKVRVNGLVKNMPETINIDVTSLGIGKSIMVGDLSFDGYTIAEAKSLVLVTIKTTRAAREAVQQEPAK